jgi:predicted flap endonuclease-1-like 5' DNA nuclease
MSAYLELVLNNVCRSNHHRIAVMALEHMKGHDNEAWRDVFLKWHPTYLEGAKAPDAEFKDFKNHVCHPEDKFWGGAPAAAREWYKRTVRALADEDWEHAAWNAGVMTHYLADPCQPFHTGQSEAEGVIHRAAEWSMSKAFPELKLIIEQHVHWPDIKAPDGEDWVEQMVRDAAVESHKHYHAMIDHYHLDLARKKPELGLDQEMKDIVARQLAYATVMVAHVMDKAIAESKARAPKVGLVISALTVSMKKPLHVLLKKLDHSEDRKVVKAQYEEYRRTGKVKHTLGDDDKVIRALHAEEVTGTHMSSIDALWPREAGTAHGMGAEPRVTKKLKKVKPPKGVKLSKAEKAIAAATGEQLELAPAPTPAPALKVVPKAEKAEADDKRPRIRLKREDAVVDAPSIGPKTAARFEVIGVKTVDDFLHLTPEEAAKQIKASHINAQVIKDWQAQALLACTVPDINAVAAQLLVGAGCSTAEELAQADVNSLFGLVQQFANTKDGVSILRNSAPPDEGKVAAWVAAAKNAKAA